MNNKQIKNNKNSLSEKLKKLFTGFCTPIPIKTQQPNNASTNQKKQKVKREPIIRNNLYLDHPFLKISRKNIIEEQFMNNQIINPQLQIHISERMGLHNTGLCYMQLSRQTLRNIMYPIIITTQLKKQTKNQNKDHIIVNQSINCFRKNTIDIVLYQTKFCQQVSLKNSKQKCFISFGKSPEIQQINQILHQTQIPHLIIICSKLLAQQQISESIGEYTDKYLFQLERIKVFQDVHCYIIYASKHVDFFKIPPQTFVNFVMSQLGILKSTKKYSQTQEQNESRNQKIQRMIYKLVQNKMSFSIIRVLRTIKKCYLNKVSSLQHNINESKPKLLVQEFFTTMLQEYPQSAQILQQYKQIVFGIEIQMWHNLSISSLRQTPKFQSENCF